MPANRWPSISSRFAQACARTGSYVLIAGGYRDDSSKHLSSCCLDVYCCTKIINIATRQVRLGGNLAIPRTFHRLATVSTGGLTKTFALGGLEFITGSRWTSSVEEWDEDNLKWKPAGNLKEGRAWFAATTVPLSVVCPVLEERGPG